MVKLLHGVARRLVHDPQQRLLLLQHLAPLDLDLNGLALPRGRHSGLLQHCCNRVECPQSSTMLRIYWPVIVDTLGCCDTGTPNPSTLITQTRLCAGKVQENDEQHCCRGTGQQEHLLHAAA